MTSTLEVLNIPTLQFMLPPILTRITNEDMLGEDIYRLVIVSSVEYYDLWLLLKASTAS